MIVVPISVWKKPQLWTAIVTLIVNLVAFVVTTWVSDPSVKELVIKILLPGLDTIAGILIVAFTADDVARIRAQTEITKAEFSVKEAEAYAKEK